MPLASDFLRRELELLRARAPRAAGVGAGSPAPRLIKPLRRLAQQTRRVAVARRAGSRRRPGSRWVAGCPRAPSPCRSRTPRGRSRARGHGVVRRDLVERRVRREPFDVRHRTRRPLLLVPAAAVDPFARASRAPPRRRPSRTISSHDWTFIRFSSSCAPPMPVKWPWLSMNPGMASCPCRSITFVDGPDESRLISAAVPSASIRSPLTAIASASGRASSTVTMRPLVRTRSAGGACARPPR